MRDAWAQLSALLTEFNTYSAIVRIALATVVGGCIGFERGQHGRAAGLRTHILVCVGAALTVLCGLYATQELNLGGDPMRVSAQVVSGIGFLGAGTILTRNKSHITGLTTAAGLWVTACIGITIGIGFYWAALAAFVLIMFSITVLARLEWGRKRNGGNLCYLEVNDASSVNALCDFLAECGGHLQITSAKSGIANHVGLVYSVSEKETVDHILEQVRGMRGIVIAIAEN